MTDDPTPTPDPASESPGGAQDGTRSPFAATPRDLPASRRGCSRMVLAGCGLVALVIGLGVLTMLLKADDLVAWSLGRIRIEVERALPDDLPQVERERLAAAFDAATEKIDRGELDPIAFQALQSELLRFARLDREPTVSEVRGLAAALEAFAGIDSAPPAKEVDRPPVVASEGG